MIYTISNVVLSSNVAPFDHRSMVAEAQHPGCQTVGPTTPRGAYSRRRKVELNQFCAVAQNQQMWFHTFTPVKIQVSDSKNEAQRTDDTFLTVKKRKKRKTSDAYQATRRSKLMSRKQNFLLVCQRNRKDLCQNLHHDDVTGEQ